MSAPPIWMVTGSRGAGKSSFCRGVSQAARQSNWDVAGLLSPAYFEQGLKTGILAEDLRTAKSLRLASISSQSPDDLAFGGWYFDPYTLAWGNRVLQNSLPCDLLIVDELGPLELIHHIGWQAALGILQQGGYRLALVVIRSELQAMASRLFEFSQVIEINPTHPPDTWVRQYWPGMVKAKSTT